LIGTHGTCVTYADLIDVDGFGVRPGWHGTGVYFWESDPSAPEIAVQLARMWSEMRISNKGKDRYPDNEAVVYSVDICEDGNILNIRSADWRKELISFTNEYIARTGQELCHADKCLIFDEFIDMVQRDIDGKISLIKAEDETPRTKNLNSLHILPSYESLTVIDVSCIVYCTRVPT